MLEISFSSIHATLTSLVSKKFKSFKRMCRNGRLILINEPGNPVVAAEMVVVDTILRFSLIPLSIKREFISQYLQYADIPQYHNCNDDHFDFQSRSDNFWPRISM